MMRNGKDALSTAALLSLIFIPGCQIGPSEPSAGKSASDAPLAQSPRIEPDASADSPGGVPSLAPDSLVAMQDFLARTSQYDNASPTPPPQQVGGATPASSSAVDSPDKGAAAVRSRLGEDAAAARTVAAASAIANGQVQLDDAPAAKPDQPLPVLVSARVAGRGSEPERTANPQPSQTTNEPLTARPSEARFTRDEFLEQFTREASGDFDGQWSLKLVQLGMEKTDAALARSASLPAPYADLLSALVETNVAARQAVRDPGLGAEAALEQLRKLERSLGGMADLTVSRVALCRRVQTFGVFDEMEPAEFVAGSTNNTIVYCELRNFQSEETEQGYYRTLLGTRLELLTADGQSVWMQEQPEIQDLCRNRRRDFFIAQRVALPPTLGAGEYVLRVRAEDKLSGRTHELPTNLTITSPAVRTSATP